MLLYSAVGEVLNFNKLNPVYGFYVYGSAITISERPFDVNKPSVGVFK